MPNKFAAINLNSEKRPNYSVRAFVSQPDPLQEKLGGKLFALIEVAAKKANAEKIIDFILDDLNTNYYQDEKLSLREKIAALKIENIFETVLVKTNRNLLEFLEKERIGLSSGDISATLGVIYNEEVHFSSTGSNRTFLLHRLETNDYQIVDIAGDEKENNTLNKLFSSLVSGAIPGKSYFIAANEPLSEYLHNEDLIKIITKLPPASAAEQVKNIMAEMNAYVSFAGLIVKNTTNEEPWENYELLYPSANSAETANLSASETATEKILAPQGGINTKPLSDLSGRVIKRMNFLPRLKHFLKSLRTRKAADPTATATPVDFSHHNEATSRRQNWLLAAAGIILLVFGISLAVTKSHQAKDPAGSGGDQAEIQDWQAQLTQKLAKIDNYLLYNNEPEAKTALAELKGLLDQLAGKYSQQDAYQKALVKYDDQLAQVQHVAVFDNPHEIVNFTTLNPQAQPENLKLVDGQLYAAGANSEIYRLTLKDNLLKSFNVQAGILIYPTLDKNGNLYYYDGNRGIVTINSKTDSATTTKIALSDGVQVAGLANYDSKLYVLDKSQNQIYRYALGKTGYDAGTARLKSKDDLSASIEMTLDGQTVSSSIYILESNGELFKYYNGQRQEDFKLEAADLAIGSALKFAIAKNIYILTTDNRVIVFDTNGKFVRQYRFSNAGNLKDLAVDETAGKLYLLADTGVRSADLIK